MIAIYINSLEMLYKTLLCDKQNRIIMLIDLTLNVAIQGKHGESSITFSGEIINREKRRTHDPLNCIPKTLSTFLNVKMRQTIHWGNRAPTPRTLWGASPLHPQLWPIS